MVYKALIVDDEPIIRYGLASTVDWTGAGVECAGEAGNGEAALGMVEEKEIDILITDIKMPKMDGLELIRLAKRSRPHLKAILISSYNDFEYARQAVQLGAVVDYLLKPTMEPEDVTRLLAVCRGKLDEEKLLEERSALLDREEKERKRHGLETELQRALAGQPADLSALTADLPGPYVLSIWRAEVDVDPEKQAQRMAALLPGGTACRCGEREIALLLSDRKADGGTGAAGLSIRQAHAGMKDELSFTVGISPPFHRPERLPEAAEWARNAFEAAFFGGTGACYDGEIRRRDGGDAAAVGHASPLRAAESGARERSAELRDALSRQLAASDEDACERTLRELISLWRSRPFPPGEVRKMAGDVLLRMQSVRPYLKAEEKLELLMDDHERLKRAGSLSEVESIVLARFREGAGAGEPLPVSSAAEDSAGAAAIQNAVAYIQERYRQELSLREAADHVHMSRNYFSEQFKRHTGLNFIDYVIRLRIRYAKHLLETTTLKVYDIGGHAGFNSAKHFLKMFKRESGCTPAEYRSRMQQGGGGE